MLELGISEGSWLPSVSLLFQWYGCLDDWLGPCPDHVLFRAASFDL